MASAKDRKLRWTIYQAVRGLLPSWLQKIMDKTMEKYAPCEVCGSFEHSTEDHPPDPIEYRLPEGPVYDGPATSGKNTGFILSTENYVSQYIGGRDKGSCISFNHVRFVNAATGEEHKVDRMALEPRNIPKDPSLPYCDCPGEAHNWTSHDDHGGETTHHFTTGHPEKEPGADGTYRGFVWVPFAKPGQWNVYIKWRATNNRGTGYVSLATKEDGTTLMVKVWKWNQRGDLGSHPEIQLGTGSFTFVKD